MKFFPLRQILVGLAVAIAVACVKSKPEPEKVTNPEWGKIIVNPTAEENKRHWDLWKSKSLRHYRYKTKITCEDCTLVTYNKQLILDGDTRLARNTSWVIIEVNNGQIVSVKNIDGSANLDFKERLNVYNSDVIEKAFEWIASDTQYTFNPRVAIYDHEYGFPRYSEILPSQKGPTDIGSRIEVIEFEVLSQVITETR